MTATARIPAAEVLDLSAWASQPDALHATREEAEEAADADARWLEFEVGVVYVRESASPCGDVVFDPPVRARIYDVEVCRWMDDEHLDPYVDFVFLDPVDPEAFAANEDGNQRGWWFSRTHRVPKSS